MVQSEHDGTKPREERERRREKRKGDQVEPPGVPEERRMKRTT